MFKRINRLPIELPKPEHPDPNAASAVQELLGGRFGEMSTLNNYMFQSFAFRDKEKLKPFYHLVASITAEEVGHVELVANTINLMLTGSTKPDDPDKSPLSNGTDKRNSYHFIDTALTAKPWDSMGKAWTGDYVFNSGNLLLDLLHNFFLEIGARTHKMRVYEMTDNPIAREMIGYLLVRGGVHTLAYAKAIETITGIDLTKMLPVPSLDNSKFEYARKYEEQGWHRRLYTFSDNDYEEIALIWRGSHPDDGSKLEVVHGTPEGYPVPDLPAIDEEFAPGISAEDFEKIFKRLKDAANIE
ncbi:manganese catalase [Insulibacter thermoxylanivorax]|uniref:Manganese catalase n=1 Tax=Insulibacter thermoxylanivorax TaxID=2749268 RepID=A0A916VGQ9_9BACL|nr:manganese catalase family protein [Insulibacter thermoxylanivorax]GFR38781.1 manganese catalase [Insulibacter thermoxylanivorax]